MTVYLDTSALVKLYVAEQASDEVRALIQSAKHVATSTLAYPEARAAFARRHREGALDTPALSRICNSLDEDWQAYAVVELTPTVARTAGWLAERHALRGYDAVHLASALELLELTGAPPQFACYDHPLLRAAAREGLRI